MAEKPGEPSSGAVFHEGVHRKHEAFPLYPCHTLFRIKNFRQLILTKENCI
jgi:hypothetical protein